jgi:ABC-type arginine transport system ATPase subunit
MPIYWGSSDIEKYLPEGSYYQIADFGHDRVAEIDEFIKGKPTEKNIKAMREARNLILDQYNIWASVEKIMENF